VHSFAWSFFSFIFSCAGRSGQTREPGEDIVDVLVGLLAHGRASQYQLFVVA